MKFKEIKTTMLLTIIILFLLGAIGCSKDDENAGNENAGNENAGNENADDENADDENADDENADDENADDSSKSIDEPNKATSPTKVKVISPTKATNSKGEVAKIENGKFFVSSNGKDFQEHLIPGSKEFVAIQKGEKPEQLVAKDKAGDVFVSESNIKKWVKQEFAGGDGTPAKPYKISSASHVNNIQKYLNKHFILIKDIDLFEFKNFEPIGNAEKPFTGFLDGKGKTITKLTINLPDKNLVGLFGIVVIGGTIKT